jgi:hypothetical protein
MELLRCRWENLGLASVVAIGPKEEPLGEIVMQNSRSGKATLARPTLKGFYELSKRSRLYVGGDTGPTHISIAAGTRWSASSARPNGGETAVLIPTTFAWNATRSIAASIATAAPVQNGSVWIFRSRRFFALSYNDWMP